MNKHRYFKFKDITISNNGYYILSGASNIETGSASSRKISYIDTDGTQYSDIYYNERVFEISGFIQAEDAETMVKMKRRLISRCSLKEKFWIEYFNRSEKYIAECYFDKLPTFGVRKKWYLDFKLYVVIPGFYWQSAQMHTVNIFGYKDEVTDTFTLPCTFTSRFHKATVSNMGDCSVYPVFIVRCENSTENSAIIIKNNTSNKQIMVNYQTSAGEIVTIDTYNQTVKSNINGNITNYVDISSEFFEFEKGINELESISLGNVVSTQFRENFLGV